MTAHSRRGDVPQPQRAFADLARSLVARIRRQRSAADAAVLAAQDGMAVAMSQVAAAGTDTSLQEAVHGVAEARARLHQACAQTSIPTANASWGAWLHAGERPSSLITSLLRRPDPPALVPALVAADGTLATSNGSIARVMAAYFAGISCGRPTDPDAQQAVLAAVRYDIATGHAHVIPPDLAEAAGSPVVTEEEVRRALAACPCHSAPGPDGIPYSLWQVGGGCWAPLLARLFTAMGRLHRTTPDFTRGSITPLLKPGATQVTSAASYRPITLLPCLYRILSRVLATRFGPPMVLCGRW